MIINFSIPDDAHILVKQDSKLDFNTPLFEKKINKELTINIAKDLEINPKNIFRHLVKLVGEQISKGDLIALKKGVFFTKKSVSPYDGIIKEIDHHQGLLIIELIDKKKKQVLSPFIGQVTKVTKNSLEINLGKAQEFPLKKATADFGAEVLYLDSDSPTDLSAINTENKIIFGEKISSFIQTKAEALGVKGFVTIQQLPEGTDLDFALIKNIDDFKKIMKNKFPHCSVTAKSDNIYFYP